MGLVFVLTMTALAIPAGALAATPVNLGTADPFGVLAGSSVTNTGPSTVFGDLGVYPGTSVTGFGGLPNGTVVAPGTIHATDATAQQAKADAATAYGVAAGEAPTGATVSAPADIGGQTLTAGVYKYSSSLAVTGTLTLDGQGNPNGLFVFQVGSTLTTATASSISYINGAQPCNVYWQVGTSATLGTGSTFTGTILAAASITLGDSTSVQGRLLAGTGDVTLIDDTITPSDCAPPVTTPVTTPVTPPVTTPVTTPTPTPITTPVTGGSTGTTKGGGSTGTKKGGGSTGTKKGGGSTGTKKGGKTGTTTTGLPVKSSKASAAKRRADRRAKQRKARLAKQHRARLAKQHRARLAKQHRARLAKQHKARLAKERSRHQAPRRPKHHAGFTG